MNIQIPRSAARPFLFASVVSSMVFFGSSAHAATIFTDDFSSPTRTGWYMSSSSSSALYEQNVGVGFKATDTSASRHMVTGFDAASVAVGETLTVNFTFSVSADTTTDVGTVNQFRFGVFNSSGGGHPTKDGHGSTGSGSTPNGLTAGFDGFLGYSGTITFANTGTQLGLRERGDATGQHLLTNAGPYTSYGPTNNVLTNANSTSTKMFLAAGEIYNVTFSLNRAAENQINLHLGISGKDAEGTSFSYFISGTDSADIVSTIDTFAFSMNNSLVDIMLRSISITQTTTSVPEPASSAALIAGLALGGACLRRRRR